jgi:predicted amidophosphoribosyltransferase
MAERMRALRLPGAMRAASVCIPVPTTRARLRERGYNQAAELAIAFAAITGRTVSNALRRRHGTGTQTTLQPLARRANVSGAFHADAREAKDIAGQPVLLVDDVLTTGATAAACATVLAAAGVPSISLITFARALDARRLIQHSGELDDDG